MVVSGECDLKSSIYSKCKSIYHLPNNSQQANVTANTFSQKVTSVSEGTDTCEKEVDVDDGEDVHVFM